MLWWINIQLYIPNSALYSTFLLFGSVWYPTEKMWPDQKVVRYLFELKKSDLQLKKSLKMQMLGWLRVRNFWVIRRGFNYFWKSLHLFPVLTISSYIRICLGWCWFYTKMSQFGYSTAKCRNQISHPLANVLCIFLVCFTHVIRTSYLSHIPADTCSQFGYSSSLLSSQWWDQVAIDYLTTD